MAQNSLLMKHIYTFIRSIVIVTFFAFSSNIHSQELTVTNRNESSLSLKLTIEEYDIKEIKNGKELLHEINLNSIIIPNEKGKPNLPSVNRFIAIPQDGNAKIIVNSYKKEIIKDINIAPSQGIVSEYDTTSTRFKDSDIYSKNELYPSTIVSLTESMYLRGVKASCLNITPVQYNPVSKELVVYTEIDLTIEFDGDTKNYGDERLRSQYWDPILQHNILNYSSLPKIDYAARMQRWISNNEEGAEYIILIPDNESLREQAQRLADYRNKQGIITKVYSLKDLEQKTHEDIRDWFINAYNNWDIAPVAICMFGDYSTNPTLGLPAFIFNFNEFETYISDRPYADVDNDNIHDIVISRISASNAEEAKIIVDKQINYEQSNPVMDENFYKSPIMTCAYQKIKWFQITAESINGYLSSIGKDPYRVNMKLNIENDFDEMVWSTADHTEQILDYFGPNGLGYIPEYPYETGEFIDYHEDQTYLLNKISQEPGFILQNRDHGWFNSWSCPPLYSSKLQNLTNYGKLPFVLSINCGSGAYDQDNCMTETFMRLENRGAVGVIAASYETHTYSNDSFIWGIWDYFENDFLPDFGTTVEHNNNYMPAFANVSAVHFLYQQNFPNTYINTRALTSNLYHAHCDAFLQLYSEVPQEMEITHDETYLIENNSFNIKAPAGSSIALSANMYGKTEVLAIAEGNGTMQTINIPKHISLNDEMFVTVTKTNHLRYEQNIDITTNKAYISIEDFNLYENNHELIFNQETYIDFKLKNIGAENSSNINLSLKCNMEGVNISNNNNSVNGINFGETINLEDAFLINITEGLLDNSTFTFTLMIEHDGISYETNFDVLIDSYNFKIIDFNAIELEGNGNNIIDPGETAKLILTIENNGNYTMENIYANLISNDNYLNILSNDVAVNSLNIGDKTNIEFEAFIKWSIMPEPVSLTLALNIDGCNTRLNFKQILDTFCEGFENYEIDNNIWQNNSAKPWYIVSYKPYKGNYCLRSGDIGDDEFTEISATITSTKDQYISFFYKTSTEDSWDNFYFSIDNENKLSISGENEWHYVRFNTTKGTHTYTWKYEKDMGIAGGSDCVWIDNISFPYSSFTSIEEKNDYIFNIYPNPAKDYIYIDIDENYNQDFHISIYNSLGVKVMEMSNRNTINIESLPTGIYLINVKSEHFSQTKKFMKNI